MRDEASKCSFCGDALDIEESGNPHTDPNDGEPVCDDCYHEHFEFTCCDCQEYGDVKDQHNLLVVFEEVDSCGGPTRKVAPGVYRIKEGPYHGGPIIGSGYLYGGNLKRIADVNPDMGGNGYPCGHLCLECQNRVLSQFKAKCSICSKESPSCLRVKLGSWKDFKANKYQWTRPKVVCAGCRHAHKGSWRRADKMTRAAKATDSINRFAKLARSRMASVPLD